MSEYKGGDPVMKPLSEWTLVICGEPGLWITPLKGEEPGPIRRWLCKFLTGFEWKRRRRDENSTT